MRCLLLVTLTNSATSYGKIKYFINSKFGAIELYLLKQPRARVRVRVHVLFQHRCTAPTFIANRSV